MSRPNVRVATPLVNYINEQGIFVPPGNIVFERAVKSYVNKGNPENLPPIGLWDVSNIERMSMLFHNTNFNEDISQWDVSNVIDMSRMFSDCSFNQPINNWNVSNLSSTRSMFHNNSQFNQPLDNWDVSNLYDMSYMFVSSSFNQPLNNWNVSNVTKMIYTFSESQFNQPLDNWDVSNVIEMNNMFKDNTVFNQSIRNWNLNANVDAENIFEGATAMSREFMPPRFRPRIAIPDPNPQGVAFQVHNAFNAIDFTKLFQFLNNGKIDTYSEEDEFNEYFAAEIQKLISNYDEPDKNELETRYQALRPKIKSIDYNTDFKMNPNPSGENAFYTILNFVKKQEKHYQDNYVKFFINDSFSAYDRGDTTSCVKGIKERIIFALGQAGYDIANPVYKEISETVFPITDSQIYTFVQNCINENKERLLEIPDTNIEAKKELVKECIIRKIQESSPNINTESINNRIMTALDVSVDMLENEALSGGRRRKRKTQKRKRKCLRKTRKHINKTRHKKSKRKNVSKKNNIL